MITTEIKALRQAETIEAVTAMIDCRAHEYNREERTVQIKAYIKNRYVQRVLNGLPADAALNYAKAGVVYANGGTIGQQSEFWRAADAALSQAGVDNCTKAEKVAQVYDDAAFNEHCSSEGCYALAVDVAHESGGIEVYNSNDENRSWSFAPTRIFDFDDSSSVSIAYGGVYVLAPNQPY